MTIIWKIKKIRKHPKTELAKRVRLECEVKEGDKIKTREVGVKIESDSVTVDITDEALLELAKETLGAEKIARVESKLGKRLSK